MSTPLRFLPFSKRGATFVIFCLPLWMMKPFLNFAPLLNGCQLSQETSLPL